MHMPLGARPATYSDLSVSQRKIKITANNSARVNTNGFKKSRTLFSTAQPHGVNAEVEQGERAGPNALEQTTPSEQSVGQSDVDARVEADVDLGQEMVNLLSGQRGYEASLRTLKTAAKMVGSMIDVVADEEQ